MHPSFDESSSDRLACTGHAVHSNVVREEGDRRRAITPSKTNVVLLLTLPYRCYGLSTGLSVGEYCFI